MDLHLSEPGAHVDPELARLQCVLQALSAALFCGFGPSPEDGRKPRGAIDGNNIPNMSKKWRNM